METNASPLEFQACFVLPENILDWFEVIRAEERTSAPSEKDKYQAELHLYLDERGDRSVADVFLTPNGFTNPTVVEDFPVQDRKFVLHIRRCRWKDERGRNVILSAYPLVAEGIRISSEFAAFFKRRMDTAPVTARSLGECHLIDGDYLERAYKLHLSGYPEWDQLGHAGSWILKPENVGESLSIDETSLHDDLFTSLSNKSGHCRRGSIVAAVRGTRAEDVVGTNAPPEVS